MVGPATPIPADLEILARRVHAPGSFKIVDANLSRCRGYDTLKPIR